MRRTGRPVCRTICLGHPVFQTARLVCQAACTIRQTGRSVRQTGRSVCQTYHWVCRIARPVHQTTPDAPNCHPMC